MAIHCQGEGSLTLLRWYGGNVSADCWNNGKSSPDFRMAVDEAIVRRGVVLAVRRDLVHPSLFEGKLRDLACDVESN